MTYDQVSTNPFRESEPHYQRSATITLPCATNDTLEVVRAAHMAVKRIYRGGFAYHKAGVILGGFVPESPTQLVLLGAQPDPHRQRLMEVIDAINGRFGHDTIRLGATGLAQGWRMKQRARSPRYTTQWRELAQVH